MNNEADARRAGFILAINQMISALSDKLLQINIKKYQYHITESTVPYISTEPPTISGSKISSANNLGYPGLTLNKKLRWGPCTQEKNNQGENGHRCHW